MTCMLSKIMIELFMLIVEVSILIVPFHRGEAPQQPPR